jgi:transglutaminase-like putative cysteine protease
MKRYFDISTHILVMSAFLALAMTGRLDVPSIVIFTAGVLWSLYRTVRNQSELLGVQATVYLSFAYIGFLVLDILVVSRSFIPATVHMVLFLELAKLHQKKSDKDYFYLIVLAFLMVLAAASLTIDISFVLTLFLFLISLVATLMSFEIVRSRKSNAIKDDTPSVSLTGVSVWATVWIVIIGAAIFILIPRVGTGYFSRASVPPVLQSGFSDNVHLGDIGKIKLSSAVVMRAKRVSGKPSSGLKWRGIALDRFDGRSWHKTDLTREDVQSSDTGLFPIQPLEHPSDAVRYDILLEPMATATLFGPYRIRAVTTRREGIVVDRDESVFTRTQQQRRVQYQVLSEIPNRSRSNSIILPPENMERYLQLPENLDRRVIALAQEITRPATAPMEKATLIEAYLRRNYKYTLDLTWPPGQQPLNTFLFDAKTGHCEYFASAMAILARSAGIPTRLVNGFQMGEFNPVGADYIVRESDAHSWVEAYSPERGWMEFDPTPPDMRPTDNGMTAQVEHYVDAMELIWSTYILVYDTDSQSQLFQNAQDRIQSIQTDFQNGSDSWSMHIRVFWDRLWEWILSLVKTSWFWPIALFAGCLTFAIRNHRAVRIQWQIWKLRKGQGATSSEMIEYLFHRAARLAERRKPNRLPAQTWREWTLRLPDANRRSIVLRALGVFEKCRYGQEPISISDLALLEDAIRELKG